MHPARRGLCWFGRIGASAVPGLARRPYRCCGRLQVDNAQVRAKVRYPTWSKRSCDVEKKSPRSVNGTATDYLRPDLFTVLEDGPQVPLWSLNRSAEAAA
jgi:hypothetical protein